MTDLVPKTNFPDIRRVCYLRSTTGTILVVPRNDKEVRLYIPVESGSALPDPKELTFDRIMAAAREIMAPYTLEAGSVSWWSAYRVGQRVGSRTSNMPRSVIVLQTNPRIHTHPLSRSRLIFPYRLLAPPRARLPCRRRRAHPLP